MSPLCLYSRESRVARQEPRAKANARCPRIPGAATGCDISTLGGAQTGATVDDQDVVPIRSVPVKPTPANRTSSIKRWKYIGICEHLNTTFQSVTTLQSTNFPDVFLFKVNCH